MQEAKSRIFFAFLFTLFPLIGAGGAFGQAENVSQLLTEEVGLDPAAVEQSPEMSQEMLEEIQALEGPLSQEELDAIKSGITDAPPVDNGGMEPLILPSGESKSAVTPQALSLPSGEASITGMGESFQPLLATGAASMSIPLGLPPGRAGVQPSLAFSYLSTAGNGIMGIGWIFSLPFIARQTDQGMPRYGENSLSGWSSGSLDRFIYNGGEEIVPVATPSETADCEMDVGFQIPYYNLSTGDVTEEAVEKFPDEVCGWWYFRTKLEGAFLRFFWNPDSDQWVVQDKSGTLMYFGPVPGTGSDRSMLVEVDEGRKIYQWNLSRIVDTHGNTVYYQYERDGGHSYLRHIWYNSPVTGGDQTPQDGCGSPGDFSCYGHHVELVYETRPDPVVSYGSGYRIETGWRLVSVTVSSRDLYTGEWVHTRDYDIAYDEESYWSLVKSIQLWGRDRADSLPSMVFDYTEVEPRTVDGGWDSAIPGFGGIDGTLHEFAWSPPHGVDEGMTDLFDANHDGFADVLVTDMARYDHGHGLFINICDSSGVCSFTETDDPVKMWGGVPVGSDFDLANTNVSPMDIDSDGAVEFLHMPRLRSYEYFRILQEPEGEGTGSLYNGYYWDETGPFPASGVDADLDFTRDAAEIRLVDLNNDHMVDVLRTGGTRMEHWINLGRCRRESGETGEGKFGTPVFDAFGRCVDWTIESINSCVLHRGLPKKFSDGDLRFADMNGDGMQDIVHIRQGDVAFWAGRGPGLWGDGENCPAGTYGDDRETVMGGSYSEMRPDVHQVFLSDVNGDGLSDLLQVRFDAVDIWINVGGYEFMARHIISRTPAHPGFTERVRFADVDGTGTPDLLWGDADRYRYMDFSGGIRPRLLSVVDNGLGKITTIDYEPSTRNYVEDMENGKTPESVSPQPSMVVARATVMDSLGWQKVTEYRYHDGFYDGCEAEFRGYREAEVREIGDSNSPTSWTSTRFYLGERSSGTGCLDDNPLEGLKGQPEWTETLDEEGVYLKMDFPVFTIETIYEGLDGRNIFQTYGSESLSVLYDTSGFEPGPEGYCIPVAAYHVDGGDDVMHCVPVRSETFEVLLSAIFVDKLGNTKTGTDYGRYFQEGDEVVKESLFGVIDTWLQRQVQGWVVGDPESGDPGEKLGWTRMYYDAFGDLVETQVFIDYPDDLTPPDDGWVIPDETWKVASQMEYFGTGLVKDVKGGVEEELYKRHVTSQYDTTFGAYQEEESVEVRDSEYLTSMATWDAGFGAILTYTGYNDEESIFAYDAMGRIERMWAPGCAEPAGELEYMIGAPLSYVKTVRNETCQGDSPYEIVEPLSAVEHEGAIQYAHVDGLGRTRGVVKEGDDENPWVVENHAVFDAKGAVWGTYLPYAVASRWAFDTASAGTALINHAVYDAFGRTLREYSPDGEDFAGTEYGLLRNEIYEKSDLVPGEYFGSTTTQLFDGLGRLVRVIDRLNLTESGQDLLATDYGYDTLGDVIRMESGRLEGDELSGFEGHSVVKTSAYDSNGVEVFQDDPDRLEMYFVYNELGDLIRWQDGRGITNSYAYDLGGRLTAEDYGNDFLADVLYGYDEAFSAEWYDTEITCHRFDPLADCPSAQENLLGKLSYVEDRSGTRIWSYDVRGLTQWVNMQMSSYEMDAYDEWIKRDDLSQIWHTETQYDEMGRALWQDFPEEGSRVHYQYSERGLIDSLVLDRPTWMDPQPVIQKVYYDALGKQTRVEYGDDSQTTVEYAYDDRQRLTDLLAHQESYDPGEGPPEDRTLMEYEYQFDAGNNIWKIIDHRSYELISDWSPVPVDYEYAYDSLNRLKTASPSYHESQPDRIGVQEWAFDKLGSMKTWTDPAHGFYGWSLANIRNGLQLIEDEELTIVDDRPPAPHALYKAYDEVSGEGSYLVAHYDFGGYMTSLEVYKGCGECNSEDYTCELPCDTAELTELFWDEVGRLIEAKKRPGTCDEVECTFSETPTTHYQHTYDSSNVRTVKKDVLEEDYDLYLSSGFEIRGATLSVADEFEGGESTKYATLFGNRVGRIVEESTWLPESESYFFLYLSNHLGSTSIVVDSDSGDVIEARMDLPYGAPDASMLNPDPAYGPFTADYTFTGKEEDADIDLFYFGERYLNPLLGRWISPDPSELFLLSESDYFNYGYVKNSPIDFFDPLGLDHQAFMEWFNLEKSNVSMKVEVEGIATSRWYGESFGIPKDHLSSSPKYGKPDSPIIGGGGYGEKNEVLKNQWKCNVFVGSGLEFTRHYFPVVKRSAGLRFMTPKKLYSIAAKGVKAHKGKSVELQGMTMKGEKVAWGRIITPEYLKEKFGNISYGEAINKLIESNTGAFFAVTKQGGEYGHMIGLEKVKGAVWNKENMNWQLSGDIKDIYWVGKKETPGINLGETGRSFQIIQSYEVPEGESGAVSPTGVQAPEKSPKNEK